jgi:hypothetical protein
MTPPFFTSTLDGGEWLASLSGYFTPREIASGIHWLEAWMGPRAGVNSVD